MNTNVSIYCANAECQLPAEKHGVSLLTSRDVKKIMREYMINEKMPSSALKGRLVPKKLFSDDSTALQPRIKRTNVDTPFPVTAIDKGRSQADIDEDRKTKIAKKKDEELCAQADDSDDEGVAYVPTSPNYSPSGSPRSAVFDADELFKLLLG